MKTMGMRAYHPRYMRSILERLHLLHGLLLEQLPDVLMQSSGHYPNKGTENGEKLLNSEISVS